MSCDTARAAIKNAKDKKSRGQALQAYLKCKHQQEHFESESQCQCPSGEGEQRQQ